MLSLFRSLSARHTKLKERVHAYRIPLPPAGQKFMGVVYFVVPIFTGYYIMQWAIGRSEVNLGVKCEKLNKSLVDKKKCAASISKTSSNL